MSCSDAWASTCRKIEVIVMFTLKTGDLVDTTLERHGSPHGLVAGECQWRQEREREEKQREREREKNLPNSCCVESRKCSRLCRIMQVGPLTARCGMVK